MTSGMAFDNSKTMIKNFTYKELTLLLGILVALIIVFTLWIRQPAASRAGVLDFKMLKLKQFTITKAANDGVDVLRSYVLK